MNSKLTGEGDEDDDEEVVQKKSIDIFYLKRVTFELRHENKSCSACPKDYFSCFGSMPGEPLRMCDADSFLLRFWLNYSAV